MEIKILKKGIKIMSQWTREIVYCELCHKKVTLRKSDWLPSKTIHYICNKCAMREPIKKNTERKEVIKNGQY